jgi:hypothetical protein
VDRKDIERIAENLGSEAGRYVEEDVQESGSTLAPGTTLYVCMDGTGVPMVKSELAGRVGKSEDGRAKTREAKLGCVFTQQGVNAEGYPVRDEESTTYVGAIESVQPFGQRLELESQRRGLAHATTVCVLGDGAAWIWNISQERFPMAVQIVDLYHAREHCWTVSQVFYGDRKKVMTAWAEKRCVELDQGKVDSIITALKRLRARTTEQDKAREREVEYFTKNKHRMRYDLFRTRGFFVGSGVLEAGCRTIVSQRLKQSGMHWTVRGANNILALRCCLLSHRWEDFWAWRAKAA